MESPTLWRNYSLAPPSGVKVAVVDRIVLRVDPDRLVAGVHITGFVTVGCTIHVTAYLTWTGQLSLCDDSRLHHPCYCVPNMDRSAQSV